MEILMAAVIAVLTGCGIYLMLRARTFPVILGLTLLSYAVNLFIFVMGRLTTGSPAVIGSGTRYADPVPQALVLTAIVIGFAMTAFLLVLALRAKAELGNDHVDGAQVADGTGHFDKTQLDKTQLDKTPQRNIGPENAE